MRWTRLVWDASRLSIWIVFTILLLSLLGGSADEQRKARVLPDNRIEFAPNRLAYWAWPLLGVYLAYAIVSELRSSHGRPLNLLIAASLCAIALLIMVPFPEKIILTADGLEQVSWLWKNKQIRWPDIVEINTGEKSRSVSITGSDGTRIVHSRQLADRPRLLVELKNQCGENLPPDFPRE